MARVAPAYPPPNPAPARPLCQPTVGLAIASEIVARNDGEMTFARAEEGGVAVTLRLPLARGLESWQCRRYINSICHHRVRRIVLLSARHAERLILTDTADRPCSAAGQSGGT